MMSLWGCLPLGTTLHVQGPTFGLSAIQNLLLAPSFSGRQGSHLIEYRGAAWCQGVFTMICWSGQIFPADVPLVTGCSGCAGGGSRWSKSQDNRGGSWRHIGQRDWRRLNHRSIASGKAQHYLLLKRWPPQCSKHQELSLCWLEMQALVWWTSTTSV